MKINQDNRPLAGALEKLIEQERVSLHVPGHKGRTDGIIHGGMTAFSGELQNLLSFDITEIPGFDDYHAPSGIIMEAQELAAELFGSEETFFLVNGTTSGIMAALAAVAGDDDAVIVARNCHKSVTRGLILSGLNPVYAAPYFDERTMLAADIEPERIKEILDHNAYVSAVILTNPTYYGTYSDLEKIVEIAHARGTAVIVDEAHGAQLLFAPQTGIPCGLEAGADIVVQSSHKMIGSLTQSSMLHVQGELVNREKLGYFARFMNTTSPSYLLMASLDEARHKMAADGAQIWKNVLLMAEETAERINHIEGLRCVRSFYNHKGEECRLEGSRLLISGREKGLSGVVLADLLSKQGIDTEMADEMYVLAVLGSGTRQSDMDDLLRALQAISEKLPKASLSKQENDLSENVFGEISRDFFESMMNIDFKRVMTPRKAAFSNHEQIELMQASGLAAAEEIAVYPPGIPLVQPGEMITEEIVACILSCLERGVHVHGVSAIAGKSPEDKKKYMVTVVADEKNRMLFNCVF